jgi:phospholipase C
MADIKYVVVLMLENCSFDFLLGFLKPAYQGQAFEGLTGAETVPLDPLTGVMDPVPVAKASTPDFYVTPVDPAHELPDTTLQLYGQTTAPPGGQPLNNGFVASYSRQKDANGNLLGPTGGRRIMSCLDPTLLPVHTALARNFLVCDHWFSSVPGPTWPNRFFVHAATAAGHDESPTTLQIIGANLGLRRYAMRTIYENLMDQGKTWKIYLHDVAQAFALNNLHSYMDRFQLFEPNPFRETSFLQDVAAGTLPSYSFIEPRYFGLPGLPANDQHPPHDLRQGEKLIATVYDALRSNPAVWRQCLFVLLYDEHGGYYDHVPPPTAVSPDGIPSPTSGFDFTRSGIRVPVILVSPWLPKGQVDQRVYDHTSLLATVKELFGLPNFLTRRDAAANRFTDRFLPQARPLRDAPRNLSRLLRVPSARAAVVPNVQLSTYQQSLEALAAALDAPSREHEAARQIESRMPRILQVPGIPAQRPKPAKPSVSGKRKQTGTGRTKAKRRVAGKPRGKGKRRAK